MPLNKFSTENIVIAVLNNSQLAYDVYCPSSSFTYKTVWYAIGTLSAS